MPTNILLGALLLALLLLPGFIFRMGYLAKPFASRTLNSSFVEELLFSLLPSFFLQVAGYLVVKQFSAVNEQTFLLLLINSYKESPGGISSRDIGLFAVYLLCVCLGALALGFTARAIALRTRLHLQYSLLRIYNEWQIYFDGIILDYPDKAGEWKKVMYCWLDVLVENKDGAYLYSGFLDKYVLGKDDTLNRLYLTAVRRRPFLKDSPYHYEDAASAPVTSDLTPQSEVNYDQPETPAAELIEEQLDKRYYFMPGDYFMIPGPEIKSINITYYTGELTDVA